MCAGVVKAACECNFSKGCDVATIFVKIFSIFWDPLKNKIILTLPKQTVPIDLLPKVVLCCVNVVLSFRPLEETGWIKTPTYCT